MHYEVVAITPQMAAAMLAVRPESGKERRESPKGISKWLRLMNLGLFRHNPADPVVEGTDKAVYNGRHRLRAVIEHGRPVTFTVLRDADPAVFDILDQGNPRTAAQFVFEGVDPQLQSAIARLTLWYRSGLDYIDAGARASYSMHEVLAEVDRLGSIVREVASDAKRVYRTTHITKSVHGAVLAIGREAGHDQDRVVLWVDGLVDGLGLSSTDPRWHLRQRFTANNPPRSLRDQWRVIVRAYNAFLHGESLARLLVPPDPGVIRVGATPAQMRRGTTR